MAIDFPNSPTTGDTHTSGGRTWTYDGTGWVVYGPALDATVLRVDSGNNRVGINNTSPTVTLDVTGDAAVSGNLAVGTVTDVEADITAAQSDITAAQSDITALQSRPVETKTASYTLVAADVNKRIVMNSASATTITVDDAVFSAGDTVWIHNIGAGTTTVTAGTATVNTAGSLDVGQWEGGSLYFTSASSAIFFRGGGAVNYGTATGGTSSSITVDGESYTLLTFTASSTLTVTKAGIFDVLVVGGGGGGGDAPDTAGAGGAGGFREYYGVYFDANQTVVIGAGGARETPRGSASSCGDPFAAGGGGAVNNTYGYNGASGGGGGTQLYGRGDLITGNNGGARSGDLGGGGGGAGAAGGVGSGSNGGAGGAGKDASAFRGESAGTTYYAGGGGGGCLSGGSSSGGVGGGGNGTYNSTAGSGTANTGGGGGANNYVGTAGNGGSGLVLVRFKN